MNFLQMNVAMNIFGLSVAIELTSVVNIDTGPVQGQILTTVKSMKYALFAGIPYAQPPIGYLRFKPPVPPEPWTEVLNATSVGDACIQYNRISMAVQGSERCLFINVYTPVIDVPKPPEKLKAVFFWVYGGGFLHGPPAGQFKVEPDTFLDEDVVYVSVNYRAGVFGFLALNRSDATGNAGLKDVVMGLEWVQRNVEKFGGDPNRVTLGGGSSGGAGVQYLSFSPVAAGLYHRMITMSGTPLSTWAFHTPGKALSQAQKLAEIMGFNATDSDSLFNAFSEAVAADVVVATTQLGVNFGPFRPTIEDPSIATNIFLDHCAIDKYRSGDFVKVPQLMGYVDQETLAFVNDIEKISELTKIAVEAADLLHFTLPPSIEAVIKALNSSDDFLENFNYTNLEGFVNDTSDFIYIAPLDEVRQLIVANNDGNPVYFYHLTYYAPGPHTFDPNNVLPGAAHGDDLPFIFYMPSKNFSDNPTASLTRDRMSTMWANFVKYGDPTPEWKDDSVLNVTWPETGRSALTMRIGTELTIEQDPVRKDGKYFERIVQPGFRGAGGCE